MIAFIAGLTSILYFGTGYLVFRKWIKWSPPQEGEYDHGHNREKAFNGWYVPALIRPSTVWGDDTRRGMQLEKVMWISIIGWPVVVIISMCVMVGRGIKIIFKTITNHVTSLSHTLAHNSFPKKPVEKPSKREKSPELIEAEQEVEAICWSTGDPGDIRSYTPGPGPTKPTTCTSYVDGHEMGS